MSTISCEPRTSNLVRCGLKTKKSRRTVFLTEAAIEALYDVEARHFKLGFPGVRAASTSATGDETNWAAALIAADLVDVEGNADRTPYAWRHTFATNALRSGLSTWAVAQRMGTSVDMIEKTYGHANDAMQYELQLFQRLGRDMDVGEAVSEAE